MRRIILILAVLAWCVGARAERVMFRRLSIDVPREFSPHARDSKGYPRDFEARVWRAGDRRGLQLLYCAKCSPKREDADPLIPIEEEPILVAGQKTDLIHAERFYGTSGEALIVHIRFGESVYIVVSEGIPKDVFKRILGSIRVD